VIRTVTCSMCEERAASLFTERLVPASGSAIVCCAELSSIKRTLDMLHLRDSMLCVLCTVVTKHIASGNARFQNCVVCKSSRLPGVDFADR
jgi:hypothetical protein